MPSVDGKVRWWEKTAANYVLQALAVAAGWFILANVLFLLLAVLSQIFDFFISTKSGYDVPVWIPLTRSGVFLAIVLLISWLVLRSKVVVLVKAIFLTAPITCLLVLLGILLSFSPILPYLVGGLIVGAVLIAFHRTHQPWIYYYSLILVAVVLMIFTLSGGEI